MKWRNLLMPKEIGRDEGATEPSAGRFVIEPLERGFGQTVGNTLRRTLLSSIQGAAVTAVRIQGVLHELSNVPGVLEDVTDIILNLKKIPLKIHGQVSMIMWVAMITAAATALLVIPAFLPRAGVTDPDDAELVAFE